MKKLILTLIFVLTPVLVFAGELGWYRATTIKTPKSETYKVLDYEEKVIEDFCFKYDKDGKCIDIRPTEKTVPHYKDETYEWVEKTITPGGTEVHLGEMDSPENLLGRTPYELFMGGHYEIVKDAVCVFYQEAEPDEHGNRPVLRVTLREWIRRGQPEYLSHHPCVWMSGMVSISDKVKNINITKAQFDFLKTWKP